MRKLSSLVRNKIEVAPSLLAADFRDLDREVGRIAAAGCNVLHLDVMDGHFVPNISFGVPVVKSLRGATDMLFDTHLMISHPLQYVEPFAKAGSDLITFHIESCDDPDAVISACRDRGLDVGVSLKPATPPEVIFPYLEKIDLVLVMTVEPGFGGQSFMSDQLPKIGKIKREIVKRKLPVTLEVDGGIDGKTAPLAISAGAHLLVAGTAVFRHPAGAESAVAELKKSESLLDTEL